MIVLVVGGEVVKESPVQSFLDKGGRPTRPCLIRPSTSA